MAMLRDYEMIIPRYDTMLYGVVVCRVLWRDSFIELFSTTAVWVFGYGFLGIIWIPLIISLHTFFDSQQYGPIYHNRSPKQTHPSNQKGYPDSKKIYYMLHRFHL